MNSTTIYYVGYCQIYNLGLSLFSLHLPFVLFVLQNSEYNNGSFNRNVFIGSTSHLSEMLSLWYLLNGNLMAGARIGDGH